MEDPVADVDGTTVVLGRDDTGEVEDGDVAERGVY